MMCIDDTELVDWLKKKEIGSVLEVDDVYAGVDAFRITKSRWEPCSVYGMRLRGQGHHCNGRFAHFAL